MWSADDVRELARVLQGTDAVVIADEVYEHIVFDGARHESFARYPEIADRAVVISSFAKTYHTTGWKVGYCAAPPALTSEIQAIHQWVTFAVNHPAQMAYADRRAPRSRVQRRHDVLSEPPRHGSDRSFTARASRRWRAAARSSRCSTIRRSPTSAMPTSPCG